jgi:creatinine amidohydrolase
VTFLLPTATSGDERARAARTALLPVGSFEQHGEYLPLITDTVVACLVAGRVAADYRVLLLPPITVSCSHEHAGFAGTVSVSARTLMAVVEDVDESLRASGIENLVIVNGHGGELRAAERGSAGDGDADADGAVPRCGGLEHRAGRRWLQDRVTRRHARR